MHCIILAYLWDWRSGDAFLNFAVKTYNVQIEIELKFENSGSQKIVVFVYVKCACNAIFTAIKIEAENNQCRERVIHVGGKNDFS